MKHSIHPRLCVADMAFADGADPVKGVSDSIFGNFLSYENIKLLPTGPRTPWPNRAEAAVKLLKKQIYIMLLDILRNPFLRNTAFSDIVLNAVLARNSLMTVGGKSPMEIAYGRRPRDLIPNI